ncbi:MAG TPA: iron-containing redox enzyme family protein [Chloroflexota bacterium]
MTEPEARARVDQIERLIERRYREKVFGHPFVQELSAGRLPRKKLVGFVANWFTYAWEVNTAIAASYHKNLWFLKRHMDVHDLVTDKIGDELVNPGPGGHIKLVIKLGEALGLSYQALAEQRLLPEARANLDMAVRLLNEGPYAESIAFLMKEKQFGTLAQKFFQALTTHYGLSADQAEYFDVHHAADLEEHEGVMAHGQSSAYTLEVILRDGYQPERPGWDLDYAAELGVDAMALLLDGVYRRYE